MGAVSVWNIALLPRYVVIDLTHQLKLMERINNVSGTPISLSTLELLEQILLSITFEPRALLELDYLLFEIFTDDFSITATEEIIQLKNSAQAVGKSLHTKIKEHQLYVDGYTPYCIDKIIGTRVILSLNDIWVDRYAQLSST